MALTQSIHFGFRFVFFISRTVWRQPVVLSTYLEGGRWELVRGGGGKERERVLERERERQQENKKERDKETRTKEKGERERQG